MGVSPDTRRTLPVDNFQAPGGASSHVNPRQHPVLRSAEENSVQNGGLPPGGKGRRIGWDAADGDKVAGVQITFKRREHEAEMHEHLENCRRPPTHHGERTLSPPGIRIWTPSNDLAPSRRRESSVTEVPGCQWDALKSL